MNCVAPDEIQAGDLLAFVEGRANQQVRDHIARCSFCAAEVAALGQIGRVLVDALYRASCPDPATLVQFQSRLLPTRERRQIERHLEMCTLCARELERLSVFDAPHRSLWEEMRRAARTVVEAVRLEPPAHLAMAVRGGGASPRLYRADELDILVGSEASAPTHEAWRLQGRVTRSGRADVELMGCEVRLVHAQADRLVASQAVDDLGYFAFEHLAAGRYDLWLESSETDIVVREVVVG